MASFELFWRRGNSLCLAGTPFPPHHSGSKPSHHIVGHRIVSNTSFPTFLAPSLPLKPFSAMERSRHVEGVCRDSPVALPALHALLTPQPM